QSATKATKVGEHQFSPVSDDHLLDHSTPGNHQPDLAPDLMRQFRAGSRQFRSDDFVNGHSPTVQMRQPKQLIRLQAVDISIDAWNGPSPYKRFVASR